jgi:hypothetical protein
VHLSCHRMNGIASLTFITFRHRHEAKKAEGEISKQNEKGLGRSHHLIVKHVHLGQCCTGQPDPRSKQSRDGERGPKPYPTLRLIVEFPGECCSASSNRLRSDDPCRRKKLLQIHIQFTATRIDHIHALNVTMRLFRVIRIRPHTTHVYKHSHTTLATSMTCSANCTMRDGTWHLAVSIPVLC